MKKKSILVMVIATAIGSLAFTKLTSELKFNKYAAKNSHKNAGGPPSGKTGAPGESNCTDCHSGTVQDGSGINELGLLDSGQNFVTEYTPGETYTVAITTAAATKRGFQVSPRILSSNAQAGTSTGIAFVSTVQSANNQQYINHNSTSNTSASGWLFTWVAPATNVGDVRFYLATNVTNNSGSSAGDVIRTSQHTFSPVSGASVKELADESNFSVGYSQNKNTLLFDFSLTQNQNVSVNLVDINGKSVLTKRFSNLKIGENQQEVFLPNDLKDGVYIVHFFVDNKASSKKIYINQ